jgi:hypothetical protein
MVQTLFCEISSSHGGEYEAQMSSGMYCRVKLLCTDVSEARTASIISLMMKGARTSETSVDNYFTRQYIPEDKSEKNIILLVLLDTYAKGKLIGKSHKNCVVYCEFNCSMRLVRSL